MTHVSYLYNRFMDNVDEHFQRTDSFTMGQLYEELKSHCPMIDNTKDLGECLYWIPNQGSMEYVNLILYFFHRYGDEEIIFSEDDMRIFYTHLATHAQNHRLVYGRLAETMRKLLVEYKTFDTDDTDYESE